MNSKPLDSAPFRLLFLALLAAGCLLLVASPGALAAPCEDTFSETVGNGWNTKANWSKGETPSVAETACLETGTQVSIGSGQSAGALSVSGPVPVRIDAGGSLTVAEGAELQGANVVDGQISGTGAIVRLKSGSLVGTGTIGPRFLNEAGTVEPGGDGAVGTLNFGSQYAQGEGGTLDLDLASDSSFDRLQPPANQNALILGHIDVGVLGSYAPAIGTTWDFISGIGGASWAGTVAPGQFSVHSFPGGAELRLDAALPTGGGGGGETPSNGAPEPTPPIPVTNPTPAPTGSPDSPSPERTTGSGGDAGDLRPESVPGPCSAMLVIRRATVKGGHVILTGVAPRASAGRTVRLLLGATPVAKAKVRADGAFRAVAPAPSARRRSSAIYIAALGSLRSCGTRLKARTG
jgi:hypothetical protein